MTDLILKSLNGVANYKSYGGKSLQENLKSADIAISKVKYTERIFDRSRSQHILKFLTCSNADDWLRLRQISAEMYTKRTALASAKFGYMRTLTEAKIKREEMVEEKNENKRLLLEIDAAQFESQAIETLVKVEGCLKEIETLARLHDDLKKRIGNVTEEAFEKAQIRSHIKRAVTQAIWEVRECGKIRAGNGEYLEQSGLCITTVEKEILSFLDQESKANMGDTSMLHQFVEAMGVKYEKAYVQRAEWLGFDPHADINLTYEPSEHETSETS